MTTNMHHMDGSTSSSRIGAGPLRRSNQHASHTWNNIRYCLFGAVVCWIIMVPLANYLQGHYRIVRIDHTMNAHTSPYDDDTDGGAAADHRQTSNNNNNNNNNDPDGDHGMRRGRIRGVRSAPSTAGSTSTPSSSSSSSSRISPLPSRPVTRTARHDNNDMGGIDDNNTTIDSHDVSNAIAPLTHPPPPTPTPTPSPPTTPVAAPVRRRRGGNGAGFHSSGGGGNGAMHPPTTIMEASRLAERQREDMELERQLRATRPLSIDRGDRPQVCYIEPLTQQCAPFFFIIGVFKAGTTSVYNYLARHPEVLCKFDTTENEAGIRLGNGDTAGGDDPRVVRTKETNFFAVYNRTAPRNEHGGNGNGNEGGGKRAGQPAVHNPYAPKTIPDYMRIYFPKLYPSDGLMTGEASPSYVYTPHVADKLYRTFPHARLILLVREPVQRAYSRVAHAISLRCARSKEDVKPTFCSEGATSDVFDTVIGAELSGMDQCLRAHGFDHSPQRPITLDRIDATKWPSAVDCWTNVSYHAAKAEARRLNPLVRQYEPKSPELLDHVGRVLITRHGIQLKVMSHGLYVLQLLYWRRLFPESQILVLRAEDLFKDAVNTMKRVEQHLHLAPFDWATIVTHKYNVGVTDGRKRADFVKERGGEAATKKSKIHTDTRRKLEQFFQPYNQLLSDYLGWHGDPWPYTND